MNSRMAVASFPAAKPCGNLAAVGGGRAINARAAGAAVSVEGRHALARQLKTTAAQFGHQVGGIAASGGGVDFLALGGPLQQQRQGAAVARVVRVESALF
jgi:hypothetical protein